jgi:hypothetical protein
VAAGGGFMARSAQVLSTYEKYEKYEKFAKTWVPGPGQLSNGSGLNITID